MGALIWIARAIILLVVLRILLRLLFAPRGGGVSGGRPMPRTGPVERSGGELVRDPQCHTYVPKARAIAVQRGGETLYFCSAKCRDEYGR